MNFFYDQKLITYDWNDSTEIEFQNTFLELKHKNFYICNFSSSIRIILTQHMQNLSTSYHSLIKTNGTANTKTTKCFERT